MSSDLPNGEPTSVPEGGAAAPSAGAPASGGDAGTAAATQTRGEELLEVLERHAPGTGAHARATGTYAFVGALAAGQNRERAALIREAAKLHTVGKIYLPAALLAADPKKLAPSERERLGSHHEAGAALARGAGVEEKVCTWILHSREHFDGTGPGGLAGAEIPVESRIIRAACRCATSFAEHPAAEAASAAARELRERAGGELDPSVASPLAEMLERTAGPSPS